MKQLQNYLGGRWVPSTSIASIELVNPANEQVLAILPAGTAEDAAAAVAAARQAQQAWAALDLDERLSILRKAADSLEQHAAELALAECQEMGKPLLMGEQFIASGVEVLRESIGEAVDYRFVEELSNDELGQTLVVHHPLGVVALIVPWNFTVTSILLSLGPLLASGNTVVIKPSEKAALSAVRMLEVLDFPPGVVNLLLGDRRVGEPLASHPDVALTHFTGSVEAGRSVGVASARNLHRAVLELGGKDPVLIDEDVDPEEVATAVAYASFVNTGQICTSMERIYVHRAVAERFLAALVAAANAFVMGDGQDPGTQMGPLVDSTQRDVVDAHVADAVAKGARVLCGGQIPDRVGFFYPATVLCDVTAEMRIMTEETFGPVAPVRIVDSFEEAIELAGQSDFGLAATVYSRNSEHIARCHDLNAGIVWINEWQGGGADKTYEPAGISGLGAVGGSAAFDASTRPAAIVRSASSPRHIMTGDQT